jgi:Tfp pilus assembly protein PilX
MKKRESTLNNEQGFVLITSLLMLVVLMIIGISATNTTIIELQISGNDRVYKEAFYQADGGVQLAARLVEENLGSPGGFTALDANSLLQDPVNPNDTILVVDTTLSDNAAGRDETNISDATRDIAYFPGGYDATNTDPHTNVILDGVTSTIAGSGLQMVAGYEGKGKGAAGGGTQILYTIYSQHIGRAQSESIVSAQWQHVVGLELEGRY